MGDLTKHNISKASVEDYGIWPKSAIFQVNF
jgi:hypothetical protein